MLKNIRRASVFFNVKDFFQRHLMFLILVFCVSLQAQNITEIEYFFGNDPGIGNGTLVPATANSGELIQSMEIPLTGLSSGFHTLTCRTIDDTNTWSLYHKKTFYVIDDNINEMPSNLAEVEYWFGVDPGIGNGTTISITGSPSETIDSFVIPLGDLEAGFQTLSIRIKNLDDTWSLFHRKTFYIIDEDINEIPSNLLAVEYWFGIDPGNGNGTAIPITGSPSETIENFAIPLGDLEAGFQALSIRIKNLDDTWSLFHRKTFYIISPETNDPDSPLTEAEFLYDAELGFGTGTSVAITPTGNPNEYLVEIPTDMETCGLHDISLSVKNALGNYSLYDITTDTDVYDNVPPTIVVFPNITVQLEASGQAPPFTIANVDNGTFDDCELSSVVLNQTQFDYTCADLGINTVIVTAIDAENKVSTLSVAVLVEDNISPVAISQDIIIQLDANGNALTTANAIDDNSTDNCSIMSKSIDISGFTCDDLGMNTVTLTITDQSGNQSNTNATVTVEDNIDPITIGQDIIIDLDGNTSVSIVPQDIDNGSNDNCGDVTLSIDVDTFTSIGEFPVVLTATDSSGNTHSVTVIVTVTDELSIEAFDADNIKMYPNPTKNILHINFEKVSEYLFSMYDISGKEIFFDQKLEMTNTINFSNYESGMYLLIIKDKINNTSQNFKIIKL